MNDQQLPPFSARLALLQKAERAMLRTPGTAPLRKQVLDRVSPWYLHPGTQARPRVLGLWGMTGTGKTHFVRELVKQLELEDSTIWMDGGQLMQSQWRSGLGDRLANRFDGMPYVLVVDEFQHAYSKRGGEVRDDPGNIRAFWEMVDSGRVLHQIGEHDLPVLLDIRDELALAVAAGMRVRDGRVVQGLEQWKSVVKWGSGFTGGNDPAPQEPWVFPKDDWQRLRDLMTGPLMGPIAMQRKLESLDTDGVLAMVDRLIVNCSVPQVVDARQGLVIVLGNLDELYAMGEEPMPELDPDVLLARHAELGLTGVQDALRNLFRIEQVARLGTDQFVFPPLGRTALLDLGRMHVEATLERLKVNVNMDVVVEDDLIRHLVEHNSIAVLGARPLLNAIERSIPDLVTGCQRHALDRGADLEHVVLGLAGSAVRASVTLDGVIEHIRLPLPIPLKVSMADRPPMERIAVHEAGHAVVGMALLGSCPLQVCARTSSNDKRGFVVFPYNKGKTIMTKGRLVPQMAMVLGGWVAERRHYGPEGIGTGSKSDIARSTGMAVDAIKEQGFGARPALYATHPGVEADVLHIGLVMCESLASVWVDRAVERAEQALDQEAPLFNAMVAALMEKGSLCTAELQALKAAYGSATLLEGGTIAPKVKGMKMRAPRRKRAVRRVG